MRSKSLKRRSLRKRKQSRKMKGGNPFVRKICVDESEGSSWTMDYMNGWNKLSETETPTMYNNAYATPKFFRSGKTNKPCYSVKTFKEKVLRKRCEGEAVNTTGKEKHRACNILDKKSSWSLFGPRKEKPANPKEKDWFAPQNPPMRTTNPTITSYTAEPSKAFASKEKGSASPSKAATSTWSIANPTNNYVPMYTPNGKNIYS